MQKYGKNTKWLLGVLALVVVVALFTGNSQLFKGSISGASWYECASENGRCVFTGTKTILYGANDKFASRTATDGIACSNSVFGDPLVGVVKKCYYSSGIQSNTETYWIYCADENGICTFPGVREVTYGARNSFKTLIINERTQCGNSAFGDPIKNVPKKCYYSNRVVSYDLTVGDVVTSGGAPYYRVNLSGAKLAVGFKVRVTYRIGKISNPGNKGSDIVKTNNAFLGITPGSYAQFNLDKSLIDNAYSVTIDADFENTVQETNEKNNSKFIDLGGVVPTEARCRQIQTWAYQLALTANGVSATEVNQCNQLYPAPNDARCRQLHQWWESGPLTANAPNYPYEVNSCRTRGTWEVNTNRCRTLKAWLDQGVLSFNLGKGEGDDPRGCAFYYPQIWNAPAPTEARCKQLKQWSDNGVLTTNGGANYNNEVYTCQHLYPVMWFGYVGQLRVVENTALASQAYFTGTTQPVKLASFIIYAPQNNEGVNVKYISLNFDQLNLSYGDTIGVKNISLTKIVSDKLTTAPETSIKMLTAPSSYFDGPTTLIYNANSVPDQLIIPAGGQAVVNVYGELTSQMIGNTLATYITAPNIIGYTTSTNTYISGPAQNLTLQTVSLQQAPELSVTKSASLVDGALLAGGTYQKLGSFTVAINGPEGFNFREFYISINDNTVNIGSSTHVSNLKLLLSNGGPPVASLIGATFRGVTNYFPIPRGSLGIGQNGKFTFDLYGDVDSGFIGINSKIWATIPSPDGIGGNTSTTGTPLNAPLSVPLPLQTMHGE